MKTIDVLGIPIHDISLSQAIEWSEEKLLGRHAQMVVTPNPEIILHAQHDAALRTVLHNAQLSIPDGSALRLLTPIHHVTTGAEYADALMRIAEQEQYVVSCIVREDGLSTVQQVLDAVQHRYPAVSVTVYAHSKSNWRDSTHIVKNLIDDEPKILLVGLGFPEQEKWIHQAIEEIPSVRLAVGIGGTFDFWTGVAKRAPKWMQQLSLEWLWRLITEPRRIKRIFKAVIIFPLTYWFKK